MTISLGKFPFSKKLFIVLSNDEELEEATVL